MGISKSVDYDRILNSFCRVSFANSKENVLEGISRICDLLDALKDNHQWLMYANPIILTSVFLDIINKLGYFFFE